MRTTNANQHFPDYEILGELGRSNARVLKARHKQTGELVAIKHFAFNTDADTLRRFQRESEIMTSLEHPNVVKVREVHFDAELPYIVMELIEGGDVRSLLKRDTCLDSATTIRLGLQMAEALRAIHDTGIIHRDIKPDNIMFRRLQSGELHFLLTDFGIARFREQPNTVTGHSAMTYEYASPEQFHDPSAVTEATDFYSLGVVLYECLCGQVPFVLGDNGLGLLSKRIEQEIPAPLQLPQLPPSLQLTVTELLRKQPNERLRSAGELKRRLKRADLELDEGPDLANIPVVIATPTPPKPEPAPKPAEPTSIPPVNTQPKPVSGLATKPYQPPTPPPVRSFSQPAAAPRPVSYPTKRDRTGQIAQWGAVVLVVVMIGFVWYYHNSSRNPTDSRESADTTAMLPVDTTVTDSEPTIDSTATDTDESPDPIQDLLDSGSQYYAQNNFSEAFKAYMQAAEQGSADAQNWVGLLYDQGKGVTEDQAAATNWYRKAAEQGNAFGQYNLGAQYYNGEGIEQDYQQAFSWYTKAAEQGNSSAENGLGDLYYFGYGTTQSNTDAVTWYRKSAQQGNAFGQYNFGWMNENGYGIDKNVDEAVRQYQASAKQGNAFSIKALRRLGYNVREYSTQ